MDPQALVDLVELLAHLGEDDPSDVRASQRGIQDVRILVQRDQDGFLLRMGGAGHGERRERPHDHEREPLENCLHGQLLRNSNVPRRVAGTGRIIPHARGRRFRASSRSFTFWIFPELVIGKSSTKTTWRGILKLAIRPRHCATTSASVSAWPGSRRTKATPTSDRRASGKLTTATRLMPARLIRNASTSIGSTFSPPIFSMSL